jgi:protein CpxP
VFKHNKTRWIAAAAGGLALVAALSVGVALAAQGRPGPGRGPGMMGPHGGPRAAMELPLRELNVTDAQRDQIKAVMDQHRDDFKAIAGRERTARKALHDAITATPPDEATIRARSADVAAVDADMAVLRARVHSEVFAVLTPEQQGKAKSLRSEMEKRFEDRANRRRGSGGARD